MRIICSGKLALVLLIGLCLGACDRAENSGNALEAKEANAERAPKISISTPPWDSPFWLMGVSAWFVEVSELGFNPKSAQLEMVFYHKGVEVERRGVSGRVWDPDGLHNDHFKAAIYFTPNAEHPVSVMFRHNGGSGPFGFNLPEPFFVMGDLDDNGRSVGRSYGPLNVDPRDEGHMPLFYILFSAKLRSANNLERLLEHNPEASIMVLNLKYTR